VGTGSREENAQKQDSGFQIAQIGPNKILVRIQAGEFFT
jgi:hypothetical protein